MLHMLGQPALARSLFPVGALPKAETRALAERFGLPVATKPDSQELCFAPSGDAGAYAREHLPHLVREGEVVDPGRNGARPARRRVRVHDRTAAGHRRRGGRAPLRRRRRPGDQPGRRRRRRAAGAPRPRRGPILVGRRRAAARRSVRGGGPDPLPRGRRAVCGRTAAGTTGSGWSSVAPSGRWRRARAPSCTGVTRSSAAAGSSRRSGERMPRRSSTPNAPLAARGPRRRSAPRRPSRRWRRAFAEDITWHAPGTNRFSGQFQGRAAVLDRLATACRRPASQPASTCTTWWRTTNTRRARPPAPRGCRRSPLRPAAGPGGAPARGRIVEFWTMNQDQAVLDLLIGG